MRTRQVDGKGNPSKAWKRLISKRTGRLRCRPLKSVTASRFDENLSQYLGLLHHKVKEDHKATARSAGGDRSSRIDRQPSVPTVMYCVR
jgi:hypothetical protein